MFPVCAFPSVRQGREHVEIRQERFRLAEMGCTNWYDSHQSTVHRTYAAKTGQRSTQVPFEGRTSRYNIEILRLVMTRHETDQKAFRQQRDDKHCLTTRAISPLHKDMGSMVLRRRKTQFTWKKSTQWEDIGADEDQEGVFEGSGEDDCDEEVSEDEESSEESGESSDDKSGSSSGSEYRGSK
jgi:hypothetical protein